MQRRQELDAGVDGLQRQAADRAGCRPPRASSPITTVQAPQSPSLQPSLVPVQRASSRSQSSTVRVGCDVARRRRRGRGGKSGSVGRELCPSAALSCDPGNPGCDLDLTPTTAELTYDQAYDVYTGAHMSQRAISTRSSCQLIRVLHTLITERSVSRAALRLQSTQPAVSAQLKRLRQLTGDPLLVRAGNGMAPTEAALAAARARRTAAARCRAAVRPAPRPARPSSRRPAAATFRIAASDYLDPLFLPELVAQVKAHAPQRPARTDAAVAASSTTGAASPAGEVDLVIGNWLQPPGGTAPRPPAVGRDRLPGRRRTTRSAALSADGLDGREVPRKRARGADAAASRRAAA